MEAFIQSLNHMQSAREVRVAVQKAYPLSTINNDNDDVILIDLHNGHMVSIERVLPSLVNRYSSYLYSTKDHRCVIL